MRSLAKACRWVSFPGEATSAEVSTSTKSRAAKNCRSAAAMPMRLRRNGRRSAWTAQNGGGIGALLGRQVQRSDRRENRWRMVARSVWCGPTFGRHRPDKRGKIAVKVIASSLRKGNIVEVD